MNGNSLLLFADMEEKDDFVVVEAVLFSFDDIVVSIIAAPPATLQTVVLTVVVAVVGGSCYYQGHLHMGASLFAKWEHPFANGTWRGIFSLGLKKNVPFTNGTGFHLQMGAMQTGGNKQGVHRHFYVVDTYIRARRRGRYEAICT